MWWRILVKAASDGPYRTFLEDDIYVGDDITQEPGTSNNRLPYKE